MDTLFSKYKLSGTRLSDLMVTLATARPALIRSWHPKNAQPRKRFLDYYVRARSAIRRFHRGDASESDLRLKAKEWHVDFVRNPSKHPSGHNARALVDYLDAYSGRSLAVMASQRLEAVIADVRVISRPHLFVREGSQLRLVWLDCADHLADVSARAKVDVTRIIAVKMGAHKDVTIEVVHAASRRIVRTPGPPAGFDAAITSICEQVRVIWTVIDAQREGASADI